MLLTLYLFTENSTEVEEDVAVDDLYDDEEDDEYDLLVGTGRAVDPRRAQSTSKERRRGREGLS